MNRMMKLALSTLLGVALVAPAFAQDQFPDVVPDNHWAYDAVANLKGKVLIGYPDGKFRGAREMTRYEFAVAIDRLWKIYDERFKAVEGQIKALEARPAGGPAGTDYSGEIQELKDQLASLKSAVSGMKDYSGDIAELKKLAKEFEKELAGLGVNVEDMKKTLADHEARLKALESYKPALDIHGQADLLVLAGHSSDGNIGILHSGETIGQDRNTGFATGMTRNFSVLHQLELNFKSTNEGPKVAGTLVIGNVLSTLGSYGAYTPGSQLAVEGASDIYLQDLSVNYDASLVGQGFSAQVGRVHTKVGHYLFQRSEYTSEYFTNAARESGDYYFDGGILNFKFGKAGLKVFGGRDSARNSTNGTDLNPIGLGNGTVDQNLGVQLMFPIGEMGSVNLAYLWLDSNTRTNFGGTTGIVNRMNVYGGEIKLKFDKIKLYGAYSKSQLNENNSSRLDSDNAAWHAQATYDAGKFQLGAGFRRVEKNFLAPGEWGQFGTWQSPVNFEGFNVSASFAASSNVTIWGMGEFVKGVSNTAGFGNNVLTAGSDDKIDDYAVGADFKLNNMFDVNLKYEDTKFKFGAGTQPKQRWYTVGVGYNLGATSKLSFKYMFSDVDNAGRAGTTFNPGGLGGANSVFKGGLLATQLTVKF